MYFNLGASELELCSVRSSLDIAIEDSKQYVREPPKKPV